MIDLEKWKLVVVVVGLAMVPVGWATNQIWSNTVHESPRAYLVSLVSSDVSPVVGDNVTFLAMVTLNHTAVVGQNVTFVENGVPVGSNVTDGSGVAVWTWTADVASDWNCTLG